MGRVGKVTSNALVGAAKNTKVAIINTKAAGTAIFFGKPLNQELRTGLSLLPAGALASSRVRVALKRCTLSLFQHLRYIGYIGRYPSRQDD